MSGLASRRRRNLRMLAERRNKAVTPSTLNAEGVLDVGSIPASSILYVLTCVGVHLFHAECVRW